MVADHRVYPSKAHLHIRMECTDVDADPGRWLRHSTNRFTRSTFYFQGLVYGGYGDIPFWPIRLETPSLFFFIYS